MHSLLLPPIFANYTEDLSSSTLICLYIKPCRTLVQAFPEGGVGVSVATDGVLYETDVLAASNVSPYHYNRYHHARAPTTASNSPGSKRVHSRYQGADQQRQSMLGSAWGQRPVLVLIGIRLGIQGVNPIYYDAIKVRCKCSLRIHFLLISYYIGAIHIPSIGWDCWWSPLIVILLRWFSSG